MAVTSRGRLWEVLNSFWMLFTLPIFFGWISFFYIGIRARQRKWFIWGGVYALPFIAMIVVPVDLINSSWVVKNLTMGPTLGLWFASMVHAWLARKEFLIRLDTRLNYEKALGDRIREEVAREYLGGLSDTPDIIGQPVQAAPNPVAEEIHTADSASSEAQTLTVDINHDPEETIAALPGVGVILAKKAVSIRYDRGGFKSIEDFGGSLGLKPHVIEQLKPLVVIIPLEKIADKSSSQGRIIDY